MVSISALLFNTKDVVGESLDQDTLLSIGYQPKDAISESYAINIRSIHNKYFESSLFVNSSYYNYGKIGFANYQKKNLRHIQVNFIYFPDHYLTKLKMGLYYSTNWGHGSISKYRSKIGVEAKLLNNLKFSMDIDYCIKLMGNDDAKSDSFIKA